MEVKWGKKRVFILVGCETEEERDTIITEKFEISKRILASPNETRYH